MQKQKQITELIDTENRLVVITDWVWQGRQEWVKAVIRTYKFPVIK